MLGYTFPVAKDNNQKGKIDSLETCYKLLCFINLYIMVFTISNLYVWTGIFSMITVIYFILVVYEKLAKKLEKEYLKSENITNSGRFFSLFFCCC